MHPLPLSVGENWSKLKPLHATSQPCTWIFCFGKYTIMLKGFSLQYCSPSCTGISRILEEHFEFLKGMHFATFLQDKFVPAHLPLKVSIYLSFYFNKKNVFTQVKSGEYWIQRKVGVSRMEGCERDKYFRDFCLLYPQERIGWGPLLATSAPRNWGSLIWCYLRDPNMEKSVPKMLLLEWFGQLSEVVGFIATSLRKSFQGLLVDRIHPSESTEPGMFCEAWPRRIVQPVFSIFLWSTCCPLLP